MRLGSPVQKPQHRGDDEQALSRDTRKMLGLLSMLWQPPKRAVIFKSSSSVRIGALGAWNGLFTLLRRGSPAPFVTPRPSPVRQAKRGRI